MSNEKLITYNGECHNISEWSSITNIHRATISLRLNNGWTAGEALGFEKRETQSKEKIVSYNGESHTVTEWSKITGIRYDTLLIRLKNDWCWTVGQALGFEHRDNLKRKSKIFISYNGESHNITEWSKITGINYSTIRCRLKRGNTVGQALGFEEVRDKKIARYTYNGETHTITEWATITGVCRVTIANRLKRGLSIGKALENKAKKIKL